MKLSAWAGRQRQIRVINDTECNNNIEQDKIDALISMCACLFGKRAVKNRVEKAKKVLL